MCLPTSKTCPTAVYPDGCFPFFLFAILNVEPDPVPEVPSLDSSNKPEICELMLDHNQEQMPKAINRRLPNGKSVPTKFEDMYPFLMSDEIKENML